MKLLEKILVTITVIGLILKFTLIPGGDMIILFTALILASLYYPMGFLFFNQIKLRHVFKKNSYKNESGKTIIFAIITGLGLSTIVIGSLFKLLQIEDANQMLLIGLTLTAVVAVISIVLLLRSDYPNSKFILWRVGLIGVVGIFLLLTPGLSIVKIQYRNHPAYVEAYTNYHNDPKNEELYEKMEYERNMMRTAEE